MATTKSGIEWTDTTWNPVTGCDKVSPGCKNCYAESVANRFFAKQYPPIPVIENGEANGRDRKFTDVLYHEDRLDQPLHWKKPRRIFVNSMSDLFHEDVPFEFVDKVFAVMALAKQHTFQVLTKRAERMREYLSEPGYRAEMIGLEIESISGEDRFDWEKNPSQHRWPLPLPNIWLGVSVENQKYADERIPLLLQTPAAKRFVSYEPALGPVDFEKIPLPDAYLRMSGISGALQPLSEKDTEPDDYRYFTRRGLKLDWIIVGGESGPGARPFDIAWARSVVEQCKAAGVAYFIKQMGSFPQTRNDQVQDIWYYADGADMESEAIDGDSYRYQGAPVRLLLKDRKGGDMEEWPKSLRVREFPA